MKHFVFKLAAEYHSQHDRTRMCLAAYLHMILIILTFSCHEMLMLRQSRIQTHVVCNTNQLDLRNS